MNLVLSRKEFRSLLEVLEIADWVLHAYKAEEPAETRPYRELEQKVLAMAESFGFEDLVDYDAARQALRIEPRFRREQPGAGFHHGIRERCVLGSTRRAAGRT